MAHWHYSVLVAVATLVAVFGATTWLALEADSGSISRTGVAQKPWRDRPRFLCCGRPLFRPPAR
jgi:hypothetical protein